VSRTNDAPVPVPLTEDDEGFNGTVVETGSGVESTPALIITPESAALSDALTEAEVLDLLASGETAAELGLISAADLLAQLNITDVEQSDFGIAVIVADESQGRWQYLRTDVDGHEWTDFEGNADGPTDVDNENANPIPDGMGLNSVSGTAL